jgi:hypothetical protein
MLTKIAGKRDMPSYLPFEILRIRLESISIMVIGAGSISARN